MAPLEPLCRALNVPPLLAAVLWSRGIVTGDTTAAALQAVLEPPLQLSPIVGLETAATRLHEAISQRRRILIHGDYDADGITGTALLSMGLRALGGQVETFIPSRLQDGYGIHPARVAEHAARADLLLTVDCGVSNVSEIAALQAAGVEVIVSDHHHPGQVLPDCLIVHPALTSSKAAALTGSGVAYHLLWALHRRLGLEDPVAYSDLASIGIIADVAPLLGENRALIRLGLAQLSASAWPGVRATLQQSRLQAAPRAEDVAFVIAPRLNAAGRLGEADLGLELLTTASERRAKELAIYLEARNQERKGIQEKMLQEALQRVDPAAPALVLADDAWHPGVMGIVASHLLERFYKPVFISAQGKGSVRSPPGISAVRALQQAAPWLERYGGHSQAAGFSIDPAKFAGFQQAILGYVQGFPSPQPQLRCDALLRAEDIDADLYQALHSLEPYGQGFQAPRFVLRAPLQRLRAVGQKQRHLQLQLAGIRGIAWQQGDQATSLQTGDTLDTALQLRENFWQNRRSVEFTAEALRPAEPLAYDLSNAPAMPENPIVLRGQPPLNPAAQALYVYSGAATMPKLPGAVAWTAESAATAELRQLYLMDVPFEGLELHPLLRRSLLQLEHIYIHFSDAVLERLEAHLANYLQLHELRQAYRELKLHGRCSLEPAKQARCWQCLRELDLLDANNRPRPSQKRNPHQAPTLLRERLEHYRLSQLLQAYRYLNDDAFAYAVKQLLR